MAVFGKNKNKTGSVDTQPVKPSPVKPAAKVAAPTPPKVEPPKATPIADDDPVFLAVLTGLVAKHGCIDSEGKPSIMVVDMAKQFLEEMRKDT